MFGFFKNDKINGLHGRMRHIEEGVMKILLERDGRVEKLEKEVSYWAARADKYADITREYDARLAKLESLVNISEPEYDDEPITTTEAILRVLNSNKRPLNFDEIFNSVKKYNLYVGEVSKASVKSTVYGLANKGKVGYGKEASTFKGIS
jgi:hypothetical protein